MEGRVPQQATLEVDLGVVGRAGEFDPEELAVDDVDAAQTRLTETHAGEVAAIEDTALEHTAGERRPDTATALEATVEELEPGQADHVEVGEGLAFDESAGRQGRGVDAGHHENLPDVDGGSNDDEDDDRTGVRRVCNGGSGDRARALPTSTTATTSSS
jgi:hypothetical protein